MFSFRTLLVFLIHFALLDWVTLPYTLAQQAPSLIDKFCTICNNSCEFGPNFHRWVVEEQVVAPDNFVQMGKVINGQYPGPTITIAPFQHLVVLVENRLPTGLTIHWHGLHQARTVSADGADFVTQNAIPPNGTYTYCMFIGDESGTHMYHAHTDMDIVWVLGALIVKDTKPPLWKHTKDSDKYNYDEERIFILSELFHQPVEQFVEALSNPNITRPPIESLLINGQSFGDWPTNNADSDGYSVTRVKRRRTYRFRIINLSSELFHRFEIDDHSMTVIEMDGVLTVPVEVDHVDIHTGQRYSVLVRMDKPVDNYIIRITENPGPGPLNGVAILHYEGADDPTPLRTVPRPGTSTPIVTDNWIVSELRPNPNLKQSEVYPVPDKVDRSILLDFRLILVGGLQKFVINGNNLLQNPETSYLQQVQNGGNVTDNIRVYEILQGQKIQIIMQNRATGTGLCIPHPWHYHGRYFYVAASGPNEYIPERDDPIIDAQILKARGALEFRDVFLLYPNHTNVTLSGGEPCGWYAIRFIANNPGMWLSHCHINFHMIAGKQFIIWEHNENNPRLVGE